MPKLHIDKSIHINATPEKVYSIISDLHKWQPWSPWLITDPDANVTVREDGKYYEWEGPVTGAGNMTITSEKENEVLDIDLVFLKPWKTESKVGFSLQKDGKGTLLHWTMDGSLPFFLFFLKRLTETMIGMDYKRGLEMLKEYAEEDVVHSKLTVKGEGQFKGCNYIGLKRNCSFEDMGKAMEEDFTRLMEYIMDGRQDNMDGNAFSIYHKWDMIRGQVSYTACVPVKDYPSDTPEGTIQGTVPATKTFTIHHLGPYRYSGNPWSAQYGRKQAKVFKQNKRIDPMEVYLNSPKNTPENELETEVVFGIH